MYGVRIYPQVATGNTGAKGLGYGAGDCLWHIGPRGLDNGVAEVKNRMTDERHELPIADAVAMVIDRVKAALKVA